MYAEERQQAMAQLISRRGRLSVVQLAEEFEVTTETVRRDLSTLDRMGLVRRVHGGAVPAGSLTVIESGIVERDQSNTQAKEAIANAAVALLPPPDSVVVIDAGSTTARFAAALPRDHRLTVITHAVPVATRLAGPAADRAAPAARQGPSRDPRRRRRRDRRRARRAARRRRLRRDQRPHRRPRPHHPRQRRGRQQAGDHRLRPADRRARRLHQARRGDRRALRHPRQHRRAGHRQRHRPAGPPRPGTSRNRGGGRMILTLTPNPSIDRTVALDGELSRGPGPPRRLGDVAGRRQGGQHLARGRQRRHPQHRRRTRREGRPVRPRAAHRRHRLPAGAPGRRRPRQPHDHRARRHHHQAQLPRRRRCCRCTSS